jgi:hypothetical protein
VGKIISIYKKTLLIFLLFITVSISAQEENISEIPVEKIGVITENLLNDPLRDIPMISEDAIESAQEVIGTTSSPEKSNLQDYAEKNETGGETTYLVWNITFGYPDNKEVLVDATNGEIISIKSVTKMYGPKNFYLISSMAIVILVILIVVFLIRRRKAKSSTYKSWEELKIK